MGEVDVAYAECPACGTLQLPDPHWLDRAYSRRPVPDPDWGALARGLFLRRIVRRLRACGLLTRRPRALDYGAGKGLLVRSMLDLGFDAWGFDPYPAPVFAEARIGPELPAGPFDFVLCSEVLEHSESPLELLGQLRDRLKETCLLLLTTELYQPGVHGADWHYLAPEHGQHITFYSARGLRLATEKSGLHWFHTLRWRADRNFQAHLLCRAGWAPSGLRLALLRVLHAVHEYRERRDLLS
jgi:SAM-dependent methyltransferase